MPDQTQPSLIEPSTIEVNGRTYIPVDPTAIAPWTCVIGEHPISTLTLKDDDLFLITDTLGNIADLSCRIGGIEDLTFPVKYEFGQEANLGKGRVN